MQKLKLLYSSIIVSFFIISPLCGTSPSLKFLCAFKAAQVLEKSHTQISDISDILPQELIELIKFIKDNLDEKDPTQLLFLAAKLGIDEIINDLCIRGAQVNAPDKNTGKTALMYAAQYGHTAMVNELINHNAKDNYALMWAAANGHDATVQLLIKHNAQVNLQNKKGSTALMLAAQSGHATTVQLLIDHHAQIDLQDNNGKTAFTFALNNKHDATVQVFIKHQASRFKR